MRWREGDVLAVRTVDSENGSAGGVSSVV